MCKHFVISEMLMSLFSVTTSEKGRSPYLATHDPFKKATISFLFLGSGSGMAGDLCFYT